MIRSILTISLIATCCTMGCSSAGHAGDAAAIGTGLGAAFGGILGSNFGKGRGQIAATGLGVAVGGLVGNNIGHTIEAERYRRTYPTADSYVIYSDPQPFSYYDYTPNYVAPPAPPPTYEDPQIGTYCREFSQEIRIDGQLHESYGTACLQPDGSWRIVP